MTFSRARIGFLLAFSLVACQRQRSDTQNLDLSLTPRSSFIEVAPGIKLQVIEWSTEGTPLVLLAGATNTAHVYEDFARYFTDHFRVIGITRRRHGASDAPEGNFGISDLVHDIIAVLDSMSIQEAAFVASSFGGAELSHIASSYPRRVRQMVFLDGAWDFHEVYESEGWFQGGWPDIPMTDADKASPQAVASYFARVEGLAYPIDEIRASHSFDANGRLIARDPKIGNMFEMIRSTLKPLTYTGFDKPTLVVRALPRTVQDFFGGYNSFDPENQRRAEQAFEKWSRVIIPAGDRFIKHVPGAEELRIDRGNHAVAIAHTGIIVPVIRDFLLK